MTGKTATATAVAVVAAFAAVQSFKHIYDLAVTHGDRGPTGALVPLSVDGLIVVATLALHQPAAPKLLAQFALWSGILATVAANVIYGLGFGLLGAVLNAWPAYAFTLGVEIVVLMTARDRSGAVAPPAAVVTDAEQVLAQVAADAESAARAALAASVAAGNPLSQRQVMTRFGLTRATERKVREAVTVASNGHGTHDPLPMAPQRAPEHRNAARDAPREP
jgi:hypothetical protein